MPPASDCRHQCLHPMCSPSTFRCHTHCSRGGIPRLCNRGILSMARRPIFPGIPDRPNGNRHRRHIHSSPKLRTSPLERLPATTAATKLPQHDSIALKIPQHKADNISQKRRLRSRRDWQILPIGSFIGRFRRGIECSVSAAGRQTWGESVSRADLASRVKSAAERVCWLASPGVTPESIAPQRGRITAVHHFRR